MAAMVPGRASGRMMVLMVPSKALAADPGGLLELAMDLQEGGRQRLHRVGDEAGDEGERQDPDRAVESARQADPGPQIGDADDQAGDRDGSVEKRSMPRGRALLR